MPKKQKVGDEIMSFDEIEINNVHYIKKEIADKELIEANSLLFRIYDEDGIDSGMREELWTAVRDYIVRMKEAKELTQK